MRISFKNLKQDVFEVDVESHQTTLELKRLLEEKYQHPVAHQKIIFAGKILQDDKVLETYGLKEGSRCVLMVRAPKNAKPSSPPSSSSPSAPSPASSPAPSPAEEKESSSPLPSEEKGTSSPPPSPPSPSQDQEQVPSPSPSPTPTPPPSDEKEVSPPAPQLSAQDAEFETKVEMIAEMGFEKDQIRVALRAAFGSAERAIEYLMNGIPEGLNPSPSPSLPSLPPLSSPPPLSASPAANPPPSEGEAPPLGDNLFNMNPSSQPQAEGESPTEGPLDFLRKHPQFIQLKLAIQQHGPGVLNDVIQQLAASNPQLLQILAHHRDDFIRLLSEPLDLSSMIGAQELAQGTGRLPPNARVLQVTAEEKDAIERLTNMFGVDRNAVIQAFLVCDRDENSTATYLLDRIEEERNGAPPS